MLKYANIFLLATHTAHIITFHCQNVALKSSLFSLCCCFRFVAVLRSSLLSTFSVFPFRCCSFFSATYASNLIKLYNYRAANTACSCHTCLLAADSDGTRIRKMPGRATTFRLCMRMGMRWDGMGMVAARCLRHSLQAGTSAICIFA